MKRIISVLACTTALLSGCTTVEDYIPSFLTPYRPDVHQGNVVTSEMLDNLHEGMTRNQVIFLLGSPTLRSTFHENEWDYIYYLNPRSGDVQTRKLQVYFNEDGRVEKFTADKMPDETDADLMILGERAKESTRKKRSSEVAEKAESDAAAQAAALKEAETSASREAEEYPGLVFEKDTAEQTTKKEQE